MKQFSEFNFPEGVSPVAKAVRPNLELPPIMTTDPSGPMGN
jgi:hypothetical protein